MSRVIDLHFPLNDFVHDLDKLPRLPIAVVHLSMLSDQRLEDRVVHDINQRFLYVSAVEAVSNDFFGDHLTVPMVTMSMSTVVMFI